MFFKRLRSAIQRQDWFSVVLELVIVVLGILIALAANDLVNQRQAKKIEVQSLREVRTALLNDINDELGMTRTAREHREAQKAVEALFVHLSSGQPFADSLQSGLRFLEVYSFGSRDYSAYETLKARGLETISDDSVRIGLSRLYGTGYGLIAQLQDVLNQRTLQTAPYLAENLVPGRSPEQGLRPVDYASLRTDPQFLNIVRNSLITHYELAEWHERLIEEINSLVLLLDEEIERLD